MARPPPLLYELLASWVLGIPAWTALNALCRGGQAFERGLAPGEGSDLSATGGGTGDKQGMGHLVDTGEARRFGKVTGKRIGGGGVFAAGSAVEMLR